MRNLKLASKWPIKTNGAQPNFRLLILTRQTMLNMAFRVRRLWLLTEQRFRRNEIRRAYLIQFARLLTTNQASAGKNYQPALTRQDLARGPVPARLPSAEINKSELLCDMRAD